MRSHVSKSIAYVVILVASLVITAFSAVESKQMLQLSALLPFNSKPLIIKNALSLPLRHCGL